MTEAHIASIVDGAVIVTNDPDGLVGTCVTALLSEPDDARLRVLARGTEDRFDLAGLSFVRVPSAVNLTRTGDSSMWTIAARGATITIRGEVIERLVEQAHEHRRTAKMAAFPIGGHFGDARYEIIERLRGTPDRGIYRAHATTSSKSYLVALGPPQQHELSSLRAQLALSVPGVAPLEHIGRLEPHSEAAYEGMIEAEPAGVPAAALALPLAPDIAAAITLQATRIAAGAHAAGFALGGLRPELLYVESTARPVVTAIAPRAERFWVTAQRRSYGVPPCFDQFFQAPELLAQPFDPPAASADVFSLAAMLAYWLCGEHPFEGEGADQAISIAISRRRAWHGPARLAHIVERALAPDPAARTSLAALIAQLEPLTL
jgi:hypothetical protein